MKPPADNNKEGAESHKLESESKPIWKSMSMFLVPLLLSNVLQSVGQLFGMVVVGRWLGVNDLAAISAFFPLFFLLVSFVIGIGSGSSILIGQAFGAKNEDRLKAIVGTALTFYLYYWSFVGDNRQYFCNGYYASNGNARKYY